MPAFIWKNNVTGSCNMARVEKLHVVPDLLHAEYTSPRSNFTRKTTVECAHGAQNARVAHDLECLISISD